MSEHFNYKSIFISDLHLGAPACNAEVICRFLKEFNSEKLYLIGDIIDLWALKRRWYWPQEHSNVIRKILTKTKRGTKVYYVLGNHDEYIHDWIKIGLDVGNILITDSVDHITVNGGKLLVTHGHLFDMITRNWKWVSLLGDRIYNLMLKTNSILNKMRGYFGLNYWSLSKWLKANAKQAANFICKFELHLSEYARNKQYDGVICGHIHTLSLKKIDNIWYLNTGDFCESCTAIGENFDGSFDTIEYINNDWKITKYKS